MNIYVKIDGWQALEALKSGSRISRSVDDTTIEYEIVADLLFENEINGEADISEMTLNELLEEEFYVRKSTEVDAIEPI